VILGKPRRNNRSRLRKIIKIGAFPGRQGRPEESTVSIPGSRFIVRGMIVPPAASTLPDHAGGHARDKNIAGLDGSRDDTAQPNRNAVAHAAARCEPHGAADVALPTDADVAVLPSQSMRPELRPASSDPRTLPDLDGAAHIEEVMVRNSRIGPDRQRSCVCFRMLRVGRPGAAVEYVVRLDRRSGFDVDAHRAGESVEPANPATHEPRFPHLDHGAKANARIPNFVPEHPPVGHASQCIAWHCASHQSCKEANPLRVSHAPIFHDVEFPGKPDGPAFIPIRIFEMLEFENPPWVDRMERAGVAARQIAPVESTRLFCAPFDRQPLVRMNRSSAAPAPHSSQIPHAEPVLGVVVIARNEERHICSTLDAIVKLARSFPDCQIVLVDSASKDKTIALARSYPISIYRYLGELHTAAAGRRIGFDRLVARYVLFVDGDCTIEPDWVVGAVQRMDETPEAAVIYGARRTVYDDPRAGAGESDDPQILLRLGGNAIYRASALRAVGSFNPFLVSEEEGEVFGRLQKLGLTAIEDAGVMFTHHTERDESAQAFLTRIRKGFLRGPGQVLRASIGNGLFPYHARRFNRPLLTLLYLSAGLLALLYGIISGAFGLVLAWLASIALGFATLAIRRRSLGSATFLLVNWTACALSSVPPLLARPRDPQSFDPPIETLQ
jgi:glycosyltransferase involved in cell wall biosynthesis